MPPFDAVLLVSFGGPQGRDDIRPFLANVLRGRPVPPSRIDAVAHHYELFNGVSPLTELTMKQAEGLRARLAASTPALPVYVGMRNWHPFLHDTLAGMSRAGVRRAIGFIMAAQGSYSSCQQYKENVRDARKAIVDTGLADVQITYAGGWHVHDLFVDANARHVRDAIARLPEALRSRARLIFTAHSIPTRLADQCRYREQLLESSAKVAERGGACRLDARLSEPERPSRRSVARARCRRLSADGARRWAGSRGALSDWLRLRSHRGPLRPRP